MQVGNFFMEEVWNQSIPEGWRIPTILIPLSQNHIDFLTNDDTNPDLSTFPLSECIDKAIKHLGGSIFIKVADRTPKDSSIINRQVRSVRDLIMLIKMSQYLTQALCEENQGKNLVLRKYDSDLESGNNQFRVYVVKSKMIGICQKQTSFLSSQPTINQIQKIGQISKSLEPLFLKDTNTLQQNPNFEYSYVIDLYCSPNGLKVQVFSIEPFYIHGLSLFSEQQLLNHSLKENTLPLIRIVEKESQMKEFDISEYKAGSELKQLSNVQEWISFMKSEGNK